MKYVLLNEKDFIVTKYDTSVYPSDFKTPDNAIEIEDDIFFEIINNELNFYNRKEKKFEKLEILTSDDIKAQFIETIESHIQEQIDLYNKENNTMFASVHNCTTYKDIPSYPHQKFCEKIVLFNALVWEEGRNLQVQIEKKERAVPTKEEFIELLPVFDKE